MKDPSVTRPALRWHGGKWVLAPWIISFFPPHRIYVEPFGGAASVLLRKEKVYAEVYNDLDDDVVNLFRVLRDGAQGEELQRLLRLTPFARTEFDAAYEPTDEPVERARRLVIRSFMGYGSDAPTSPYKAGFRSNSRRSGTVASHDWENYAEAMPALIERVRGLCIEHRDATAVMLGHDDPEALHYVDPPYILSTRMRRARRPGGSGVYRHEMDDKQHQVMLEVVAGLEGMVVLSGYPHPAYDDALAGWKRVERQAMADGGRPRTEVLWINPAAVRAGALKHHHPDLFGAQA